MSARGFDIDLPAICETRARLASHVAQTPIHLWKGVEIDQRLGVASEAILKLELFQYTGSFKLRGALNVMLQLPPHVLARGVVAASGGNHGIALAYAARRLGTSAQIVMRRAADPERIERCKALGAEVSLAADAAEAYALADRIAEVDGRTLVHPFEGRETALGTATIALELHEQVGALDAVVVPIGGGGLCAGIAAAMKQLQPHCRIFGVEPEGADTMHRSFAAGAPARRDDIATIADSLAPPYALPYSFAVCREYVDHLVMIDDRQIRAAMALLWRELKLGVEPAAAASVAALLGPLEQFARGKRIALIVSGTNIRLDSFVSYITGSAPGVRTASGVAS
jgi:threonine dehydratase